MENAIYESQLIFDVFISFEKPNEDNWRHEKDISKLADL